MTVILWLALTAVLFPFFYVPLKLWDMHKKRKQARVPSFQQMMNLSPSQIVRMYEGDDQ